jgi:hypothetical protein
VNVPDSPDGHPVPHDLHDLFACADRACAQADCGDLAQIAHLLGLCISPPAQFDLIEIERLAALDVGKASFLWMSIRPGLRHKLFEQDADHDTGKHAQRA